MRRILVLLPATLLIAAAPPPPADVASKGCMNKGATFAAGLPDPNGFRRLDQLPPANEILTVIHTEDGCMKPVIVRYGIGGNPSAGK